MGAVSPSVWVIFDFAGVIGEHQRPDDLSSILRAAGSPPEKNFWQSYWLHRDPYDRGHLSDLEYWSAVAAGTGIELADLVAERLVELDVASWLHPNPGMVALLEELSGRGTDMALLSNAPLCLAEALEDLDWLRPLRRKFFSSRLRRAKPDPAVYEHVAASLGAATCECVFLDDRPGNVNGASRAGMRGFLFTDVTTARRHVLAGLGENTFDA